MIYRHMIFEYTVIEELLYTVNSSWSDNGLSTTEDNLHVHSLFRYIYSQMRNELSSIIY